MEILTFRDDFFTPHADAALWTQLQHAFGVERVTYLCDGVRKFDPKDVVVFDEDGAIPLSEFEHPSEGIYLFGNTGMRGLQDLYPEAVSVRIEVPFKLPNQGLFGVQAAAIALYDREMKRGR